jgi:hypothetical protein
MREVSVEHISEGLGSHHVQKGYLDAKRKTESDKNEEPRQSTDSDSDRVEISENAKRLAEKNTQAQQLKDDLNKLSEPELRQDKIRQAEIREWTGHYERQDVQEKIVKSVLDQLGSMKALEQSVLNETDVSQQPDIELRWDKIQEVSKRIEALYYERKEIMDSVIDRLLGL